MSAARATLSKFRIGSAGLRSTGFSLSTVEIIAILATAGLLIGAVTYYWTSLRPEEERLKVLEQQYTTQQADIARSIILKKEPRTSPAEQAKLTLGTLSEFREDHLTSFGSGRIALINELNALSKKHSLQLTSGIDMATEAEVDADNSKDKAAGKGIDLNKVFPSMFFRVTMFGPYKNLRGFLADLERNKQFLVIDSIGLVNQELKTPTTGRGRGQQQTESGSSGIALTVEVWAYFRPAERA